MRSFLLVALLTMVIAMAPAALAGGPLAGVPGGEQPENSGCFDSFATSELCAHPGDLCRVLLGWTGANC